MIGATSRFMTRTGRPRWQRLSTSEVAGVMRHLEGQISADEMQRMNYAVDAEKRAPAEVVRGFLDTIERFNVKPR